MFISKEEKELLQQAIILLQTLYLRMDLSDQEDSHIARATQLLTQPSPSDNSVGLNFIFKGVNTEESIFKSEVKGIHKFTYKELKSMPEKFKIIFNKKIATAHWRNRNGYLELRCMIDGRNYSGSGKTEDAAVERFIKSLYRDEDPNAITKNIKFRNYVNLWLETVKKPNIKENTYKLYVGEIERTIYPVFGDKKVSEIRQIELQKFINDLNKKGLTATANKMCTHLTAIFKYAVIDGIIDKSPMERIVNKKTKTKHGTALTREEEKFLLNLLNKDCKQLPYYQALVVLMYTGMRCSELATACISGEWIIINSAKQRLDDEKIRRVPITPMLKKVLPQINFEEIKKLESSKFWYYMNRIMKGHHPHDLRHTFITRCQECGIRRELVSLWAGHNADSSITTTIYTHLEQNQNLQLEEAKKLDYDI